MLTFPLRRLGTKLRKEKGKEGRLIGGGPKVPLLEKVKLAELTETSASFRNPKVTIFVSGAPEDIAYFKGEFKSFVVTFQPVADDNGGDGQQSEQAQSAS